MVFVRAWPQKVAERSSTLVAERVASVSPLADHVRVIIDSALGSFRFPSDNRIKKRKEFLEIQQSGKKLYAKHFLVVCKINPDNKRRLGITVSRKISKKAVCRNKVKRRAREIFRLHQEKMTKGIDIVVIARKGSELCSFAQMRKEILGSLKHGGFL